MITDASEGTEWDVELALKEKRKEKREQAKLVVATGGVHARLPFTSYYPWHASPLPYLALLPLAGFSIPRNSSMRYGPYGPRLHTMIHSNIRVLYISYDFVLSLPLEHNHLEIHNLGSVQGVQFAMKLS